MEAARVSMYFHAVGSMETTLELGTAEGRADSACALDFIKKSYWVEEREKERKRESRRGKEGKRRERERERGERGRATRREER